MTKQEDGAARVTDGETGRRITRRLLLQGGACAAVGMSTTGFSSNLRPPAQAPPLSDVIRAMSAVTGSRIEENWVGQTAVLVGIILDYSKGLRALDLGELEPATDFVAR